MVDETHEPEVTENTPHAEAPADESAPPAAADAPASESVLSGLNIGGAVALDIGSEAAAAPLRAPQTLRGRVLKDGTAIGTGRRKTGVARVRIKKGSGKFVINGRDLEDFFKSIQNRLIVESPLRSCEMLGQVDVWVRAEGGGTTGQAGAIMLGIARALQAMNPELHGALSDGGYLTRDGRMVERKKYGHRKARRSFQFSKR